MLANGAFSIKSCCGTGPCSIEEKGLYDHIIYNDDVDAAYAQLAEVAARALQGGVGTAALEGGADNAAVSAGVKVRAPSAPSATRQLHLHRSRRASPVAIHAVTAVLPKPAMLVWRRTFGDHQDPGDITAAR